MRRVIFLDIDGVLNSACSGKIFKSFRVLDPEAVCLLRDFTVRYNMELVISSTWRIPEDWLDIIRDALAQAGWSNPPIVGKTPSLHHLTRGHEIQAWLEQNSVDSFIILDDDADMLPEQMDSFVRCNNRVGLTAEQISACERLINL